MPNPVMSVGAEELQHNGVTNVTDYLRRLPALAGSLSNADTSGYNTPAADDGSSLGGLNLLDLRNLGYVRTLVLVDGRRHVSESTGSAAVDTDTIPVTLIDRVDVSTGGASAIYGADAVSGVVNFVMKHDLEGVHTHVQYGDSQDGGGGSLLAAATIGHNFDDGKGNVTLTYERGQDQRLYFTQRDFLRVGGLTTFVRNPDDHPDRKNIPDFIPTNDERFVFSAVTGALDTNLDEFPDFTGNGQRFNIGTPIDDVRSIGGSGQPAANVLQGDILPETTRNIGEITGDYTFSPAFKVSGEFKYAGVTSSSLNTPPFDDETLISPDNPFLPANVRSSILANGVPYAILSEDYLALRAGEKIKRDTYRAVADVSGDIAPDSAIVHGLHYDLSYVYGATNIDDIVLHNRIEDRFFAALDAVTDPKTGRPTCRSNLNPNAKPPALSKIGKLDPDFAGYNYFTDIDYLKASQYPATFTPGPDSGCIPFNPFDPSASQSAAIAFVTANTHTQGELRQHVVTGVLSGDFPQFANIFAGPLNVVIGGEYRYESSDAMPDALTQSNLLFESGTLPVSGSFDVKEAFGEVSQTLVSGKPFMEELTVDGAVRQSSYSTAGDSTSWKYGAVWAINDDIRFRATEAVAVRAPNIGELFAPAQRLFDFIDDPCDKNFVNSGTQYRLANCQAIIGRNPNSFNGDTGASILTVVSGNSDLRPETARTLTAGVVIQPKEWTPDLSLSADFYRVRISNAIEAPGAQSVADECADLTTIDNPFCASIVRNPKTQVITQVSVSQINVAQFETSGVDFTANYHVDGQDLTGSDIGTFDIHLTGNWLQSLSTTPLPGQAPVDTAGVQLYSDAPSTGGPHWQGNLDMVWNYGNWTVDYNIDWYGHTLRYSKQTFASQPDEVAAKYRFIPARFDNNVQVSYQFSPGWTAYTGVNNLFYQKPAIGDAGYPVSDLGRFFYVGLNTDLDL